MGCVKLLPSHEKVTGKIIPFERNDKRQDIRLARWLKGHCLEMWTCAVDTTNVSSLRRQLIQHLLDTDVASTAVPDAP